MRSSKMSAPWRHSAWLCSFVPPHQLAFHGQVTWISRLTGVDMWWGSPYVSANLFWHDVSRQVMMHALLTFSSDRPNSVDPYAGRQNHRCLVHWSHRWERAIAAGPGGADEAAASSLHAGHACRHEERCPRYLSLFNVVRLRRHFLVLASALLISLHAGHDSCHQGQCYGKLDLP